jgi:GxxExxY protein
MENFPEIIKKLVLIANDVFISLGPGYNEVVYHRAFEVALRITGINYLSEVVLPVVYKGYQVGNSRIDLIVNDVIIEFKALNYLNNDPVVQIKNYIKQYSNVNSICCQGLVINFNQKTGNVDKVYVFGENQLTIN